MIRYCTQCGSATEQRIPEGDGLLRAVCPQCAHIQYENPRLIVGCLAVDRDQILLCRRAIEPRLGYWTLPAGFMENGETTAQGAARETLEEAGANVVDLAPFAMVSIAHINQVHLFYRARLLGERQPAGPESLEVRLFAPAEIPWPTLAFTSVHFCLERYLAEAGAGRFGFHEAHLGPDYRPQSSSEN